jgi:hypothetical protein
MGAFPPVDRDGLAARITQASLLGRGCEALDLQLEFVAVAEMVVRGHC